MKQIFIITKATKKLIIMMTVVVIIGAIIAYIYYSGLNKSEDPRISNAKQLLVEYDKLVKEKKYSEVFPLLDSVEDIYSKIPAYADSYELGVVNNNRAAALLLMALYEPENSEDKDKLLAMSKKYTLAAINIYQEWIERMKSKSEADILIDLHNGFIRGEKIFEGKNIEKIIDKRAVEIKNAQLENKRRLSVAYTNLGIIQRHQLKQEDALESYEKALLLWKDNHTARNNLNVLLGRPTEDRTILEKLFPPERLKE